MFYQRTGIKNTQGSVKDAVPVCPVHDRKEALSSTCLPQRLDSVKMKRIFTTFKAELITVNKAAWGISARDILWSDALKLFGRAQTLSRYGNFNISKDNCLL